MSKDIDTYAIIDYFVLGLMTAFFFWLLPFVVIGWLISKLLPEEQ